MGKQLDLNTSSLARIPLFANLDAENLLKIQRSCEVRQVRGKQIVFLYEQKSDNVFVLNSGRVKLTRGSSSGRELTYALVNPQEIFGETGLFSSLATYTYSCEAMEDSSVYCFNKLDLERILELSTASLTVLYQTQIRRRVELESRLSDLIFFDVTARLAQLLVSLGQKYGRPIKIGTVLKLKITHQDLANLIGSTRETTTLILSEFRRRGLIEFAGRKIIVVDSSGLMLIQGATYLHKNGNRRD